MSKTAPTPGSAGYAGAIARWIGANVPDEWEGVPIRFRSTFDATVSAQAAFAGGRGDRGLLTGFNLEMWGAPTSAPMRDPGNANFVYQRFQRGVMHHDRATGATEGLLLATYLRALMTGDGLPGDLELQAAQSPLLRQYDVTRPRGLARPDALPDTDLSLAFLREPLGR
jgi:hypothetical protein